jgi:NIMA (never in mitosis gene a)-related kinase
MDDFQILSKLGEGAYSIVYKVMRKVDKKIYALKKVKLLNLSDKEKENALNEVRILASVKSNFVVSYKEAFFDEKDRTLCIVMEFADNGDLLQKITEHKKRSIFFDESTIWHIFIQLVRGLKSLHDLNILHRDLKCANVFLYSNGEAKIGDLNVSKVTRGGMGTTQTGTPYYASPEVWNDCPYDSKSDIWSLGCVLYEMITLKPPFRAADMEGLYKKVTKGQYSKIPDIFSNDLHQIIIFLLQVNPKLRPSCDQILNHPIVQKRIDYFKVITGENENKVNKNNNNKGLLKTIHMPKNLIFLSDKLPKPNYDKSIKEEIEENDERNGISYQEIEHKEINEGNNIKKYNSLSNPVKYYEHANSLGNIQPGYNFKKLGIILNSNKIGLMPTFMVKNININQKQQHNVNLPNIANGDKISLNRRKKNMQKQLVSLDIISKQKNELSKLMLNNNIHRKLHYLNNRGYLNPIQMKDLYKIYPNLNNRSLPQKLDQNKLKQKYLNHQDSKKDYINEIKKIENDHEYNIKNNNKYVIKNIYNNDIIIKKEKEKIKEEKEGPEIKIFPKKKLNPIKVTKKSEE